MQDTEGLMTSDYGISWHIIPCACSDIVLPGGVILTTQIA